MESQLRSDRESAVMGSEVARVTSTWYDPCEAGARVHTVRADRKGGHCKPPRAEYGVRTCPISRTSRDFEMFCPHDDVEARCCCQKHNVVADSGWTGIRTKKKLPTRDVAAAILRHQFFAKRKMLRQMPHQRRSMFGTTRNSQQQRMQVGRGQTEVLPSHW